MGWYEDMERAEQEKDAQEYECYRCGFYDSDYGCTCSSLDMWYACPIESKKPENQKELEEMAKWYAEKESVKNDD